MLGLAVATDVSWGRHAAEHVDEILLEQAHLEKKAAASAVGYLFRYPEQATFQRPLSELAREELDHFERVLAALERRGVPFGRQRPSPYAAELLKVVRPDEPERLLDSLLCSALIEARSCERMKLLGAALEASEPELAALYRDLVHSEARHHGLFLRLARRAFDPGAVAKRLAEVAAWEAEVIERLPPMARLHTRAAGDVAVRSRRAPPPPSAG